MIDLDLERRIKDCQELSLLWKKLREFLLMANAGQDLTPENEAAFLTIKSEIAIRHDSLMDSLPSNQANAGQTLLDIVIRSITLKFVHTLSAADLKKMDQEWHDSFILLTEVIGQLEEERDRLAKISKFSASMAKWKKSASTVFYGFVGSGYTKIVVFLLVIGGVFYGIDEFMWSNKADWGETPVINAWYTFTGWYRRLLGLPTE